MSAINHLLSLIAIYLSLIQLYDTIAFTVMYCRYASVATKQCVSLSVPTTLAYPLSSATLCYLVRFLSTLTFHVYRWLVLLLMSLASELLKQCGFMMECAHCIPFHIFNYHVNVS